MGGNRDRALHEAYSAGWKTMPGLADVCGLSVAHVGRVIRREEKRVRPGRDPVRAETKARSR